MKRLSTLIVLGFTLAVIPPNAVASENQWFVSLYAGQYSSTALNEILRFNAQFEDSHVYVLSLGKELGVFKEKIGIELEGQVAAHSGQQDHAEINASFTLRWLPFPWDHHLDTSFAFGNGVSYATEESELEILDSDEDETSLWLYYILVEWAFAVPHYEDWDLFVRVHHRSSVFGLINGLFVGSNFVGLGLRYRF